MPPQGSSAPASARSADGAIAPEDFYAFPPSHAYVYMPCREFWPAESVNSILPPQIIIGPGGQPLKSGGKIVQLRPSQWLDRYRRVEQMTWAPGLPEIIRDKHVVDGGWFDRPGGKCLNLYRPPRIVVGDADKAEPWLEHLLWLYREQDAKHILSWLAQRVQRPGQKINHALLMGGNPGIGKDLLLAPVREAVGAWNFHDIQPPNLLEPFNPFVKSVILRVNEAHDLGELERVNRFSLYERTKIYAAAPPEVLRCHEKHLRPYYVPNVLGLIITTNHESDGIYLPADDRRHYVAWSERRMHELTDERRLSLWHWLERERGIEHVTAYLWQHDLSSFDAYAPPLKTNVFHAMAAANIAPEDMELADAIEAMKAPDALTLADIVASPGGASLDWLLERKSRRAMPFRFDRCGYVACRNPNSDDGRWKINDKNQTIYVKKTLPPQEQFRAAQKRRDRG
jgi:hypothetical protein